MNNAIDMRDTTRFYGDKRGVQDLNLAISNGSVFGLLGENGSGKTTAMKLAMGMLFPDAGTIRTLGEDPARMTPQTRARIGWLPDVYAVPSQMTLRDAMALQAAYFPTWNSKVALELARQLDISPATAYGELSLGQRRRFAIILVLAQMPELLVLDEPAGGLDTSVRRQLIDVLVNAATSKPITIVLSSHILSDVERLVDTVAFMKGGAVVQHGDLESLRGRVKRLCTAQAEDVEKVRQRFHVLSADMVGDVTRFVVSDFCTEALSETDVTVEHLNLEELFLVFNSDKSTATSMAGAMA